MKKWITLLCILTLPLFLSACEGTTDNVEIYIGSSTMFSESEIQAAIDTVLVYFKDFEGCDLLKLWYDEDMSVMLTSDYIIYGRGSVNIAEKENVIILLGDFYSGEIAEPYFAAGSTNRWKWVLIRENTTNEWIVDCSGWGPTIAVPPM